MVPELRRAYNEAFTAEAYERMRRWLESEGGSPVDFRISETPLFVPLELARELDRAAREICGQVMSPDYLAIADRAIPPGTDETPEKGTLTFVDNAVDPSTGTLKLKASFPNQSHRLWPGQFVITRMTLATPEVLVVPFASIQNDQKGQHVFVIKADNTAEFRSVTIERSTRDALATLAHEIGRLAPGTITSARVAIHLQAEWDKSSTQRATLARAFTKAKIDATIVKARV